MINATKICVSGCELEITTNPSLVGSKIGGYSEADKISVNPGVDADERAISILHEVLHKMSRANDLNLTEVQLHGLDKAILADIVRNDDVLRLLRES